MSWLAEVSERVHSTLRVAPKVLFEEEKKLLKSFEYKFYEERKVDKVGLISWTGKFKQLFHLYLDFDYYF